MTPNTAVRTPARSRKPLNLTTDGRVPGMRHDRRCPIYVVGDYGECGTHTWWRASDRRFWTARTELLCQPIFVDAVVNDFGDLVTTHRGYAA